MIKCYFYWGSTGDPLGIHWGSTGDPKGLYRNIGDPFNMLKQIIWIPTYIIGYWGSTFPSPKSGGIILYIICPHF